MQEVLKPNKKEWILFFIMNTLTLPLTGIFINKIYGTVYIFPYVAILFLLYVSIFTLYLSLKPANLLRCEI
jgi:hypothetical protein